MQIQILTQETQIKFSRRCKKLHKHHQEMIQPKPQRNELRFSLRSGVNLKKDTHTGFFFQALFLPVSKKLKAQKTQKISASKKTQGQFWAKNSVCWSQFEISAKKLWNFDHLKPILTDFMVKNETFKDFLIILAQNSCIWGKCLKFWKKNPQDFEEKLNDLEKNSMLRSL